MAAGLAAFLTFGALTCPAADWPQYRGPAGNGISTERLQTAWPATGLKSLWTTPLTAGFSSLAVSGGKVFTLVARSVDNENREVCVALDATTGKELWAAPVSVAKYDGGGDSGTGDNKGGDGPRSTPAVSDGRVYVLDARLWLVCLDGQSGKTIWSKDLVKEHGGRNIGWQNAASPIVEGDVVLVAGGGAGQALLGFNKQDGTVVWKGQDEAITHATPVPATIHGIRQVIFFTQKGLVAVAPATGEVLWRYGFPYNVSTAASPVVAGDLVFCSAGYEMGAGLCRIGKEGSKLSATEIWRKKKQLINHWSTPVVKDGYLYGMFQFKEYGKGPLKCVELSTGTEKWAQPGFGPGNVILVDGKLLALSDSGELVVIDADPQAYKELARAKVLAGKCWSTPAFSDGRVYVRSTKEGACFDLTVGR